MDYAARRWLENLGKSPFCIELFTSQPATFGSPCDL